MKHLIVLSGPIGVGKSSFFEALETFGAERISTRSYILDTTGCENERRALQDAGDRLDRETDGGWGADAVEPVGGASSAPILVLDSARIAKQVAALRSRFGGKLVHIHLYADHEVLEERYMTRASDVREFDTYEQAAAHGTEAQVSTLADIADLVLDGSAATSEELAATAMAWLGQPAPRLERTLDVIVGGQYGSEGKGNVCAHLAENYDCLVRIGGPNAGHRVADPKYKYVQFPSGSKSNPNAKIVIAAGSTLWLPQLMLEMLDHDVTPERLTIDPQAIVIDDEDRRIEAGDTERGLNRIATTAQGVGAAAARKILNRGDPVFGPPVKLARDVEQLRPYVRSAREVIEAMLAQGRLVMLEGTQGTELSIHHGRYPHVTSRETSSSGCLADAGVSFDVVRDVIMVVRTYPIRVGGPSGAMGQVIDFETIQERSNIPIEEFDKTERGTVSGRKRRVAEFDWARIRRSAQLNGATKIALTFADYFGVENREATDYASLNEQTQAFIRKLEMVTGVPVAYVSKAFAKDGVLEKGTWT